MSGTLYIDTNKIRNNIISIKQNTQTKFCAVVKANCYGVGTEFIVPQIVDIVDYFAVATVEEANMLANFTDKPILILSPPTLGEIERIIFDNICFAVDDVTVLKNLCKKQNKFKIHIAVNTGMNRYGTSLKEFEQMLKLIKKSKNISLLGVFSHFFASGEQSKKQYQKFLIFKQMAKRYFDNLIFHISNSQNLEYAQDMVRVGIGLYLASGDSLTLCSQVVKVKTIKKGEVVSYDGMFVATKSTKIAVVPLGYADGINRKLCGWKVLIGGKFCPIVGNVCMDAFMVDVSGTKANVGSNVTIFGATDHKQISICQMAKHCDTISYEILVHLGARIQRKSLCKLSQANSEAEN